MPVKWLFYCFWSALLCGASADIESFCQQWLLQSATHCHITVRLVSAELCDTFRHNFNTIAIRLNVELFLGLWLGFTVILQRYPRLHEILVYEAV